MTDYELFNITHSNFSEASGDKPIGKLSFFAGGVLYNLDMSSTEQSMFNGCEVVGITKKNEKRPRDIDFKNYYYLQIGYNPMFFCVPIAEDYVVSSTEIPIPKVKFP